MRVTLREIQRMKGTEGEPIAMVTAYDYPSAGLADRAGVPLLLVGDSLGMVVHGHDSTLPVTLDDMVRHAAAVVRGSDARAGDRRPAVPDLCDTRPRRSPPRAGA